MRSTRSFVSAFEVQFWLASIGASVENEIWCKKACEVQEEPKKQLQ